MTELVGYVPRRLEEPRCQFGICRRDIEFEVTTSPDIVPVLVCGLHVTPVVVWGTMPDAPAPVIRHLGRRPESAA
jgi:hypothetical protein